MSRSRILQSLICMAVCISFANADPPQGLNLDLNQLLPINEEAKATGDLAILKESKWKVVEVRRDGATLPAQFGQQPGDVITFDNDAAATVFG